MHFLSSNTDFFNEPRLIFRNVERGSSAPKSRTSQSKKPQSAGDRAKKTMQAGERLRKAAKRVADAELKRYGAGKKELTNFGLSKALNKILIPAVNRLLESDSRLLKMQRNIAKAIAKGVKASGNEEARAEINLFKEMETAFIKKFSAYFRKNNQKATDLLTKIYVYKKHNAPLTPAYVTAIKAVGGLKVLISAKTRKLAKIGSRMKEKKET